MIIEVNEIDAVIWEFVPIPQPGKIIPEIQAVH